MNDITQLGGKLYIDLYQATMHQQIPSRYLGFRNVLEILFAELTRDVQRVSFDGLHHRCLYIFNLDRTPAHIQQDAHFARMTANKIIHPTGYQLAHFDDGLCIRGLSRVIEYFTGVPIPPPLQSLIDKALNGYVEVPPAERPSWIADQIYSFRALVTEVIPGKEGIKSRILYCENDDWGSFSLYLWDNRDDQGQGSDLTRFADMLQYLDFPQIYVEGAKAYPQRDRALFAPKDAYIVLEPDYLLESKKLAECVHGHRFIPALYLMDRFQQGTPNVAMLTGMLAGSRLDDLHRHPNQPFLDTWRNFQQENILSLLLLATNGGIYQREPIQRIYLNVTNEHEQNLQAQAARGTNWQAHLEPYFISAEFGLLGKLDILYEGKNNPANKQVIELKSGAFPPNGIYPNHEAQALAYELLLQSVFPGSYDGATSIFYSRDTLRPIAAGQTLKKQQLLMLRNAIVSAELLLSKGDMSPLWNLSNMIQQLEILPNYKQAAFQLFAQKYQGLNKLDRAYFEEYVAFTYREMRIAKIGAEDGEQTRSQASLWKRSKMQKMADYDVLVNLRIRTIDDNHRITLDLGQQDLFNTNYSALRIQDSIVFYPTPDSEVLNPLNSQIFKGSISAIGQGTVTITLLNKQVDTTFFKRFDLWAIERDFIDSTYKQWLASLFAFISSQQPDRDRILGLTPPRFREDAVYEPLATLNSNQNDMVRRALSAENYFLIQGPPGTGKTSVILTTILKKLIEKKETILVLAFTNRAVDEISEKLQHNGLQYIRLGRSASPRSLTHLAATQDLQVIHQALMDAQVVVSTINSFVSSLSILSLKQFDTLIVDEASQITEAHLVGWLPKFKRFLLIGDEKQLPPVVVQDVGQSSAQNRALHEIGLPNLRESLFNRLLSNAQRKGWDCYGLLQVHYRMHRDVAAFINQRFYGGLLQHDSQNPRQSEPITLFNSNGETAIERALARSRVIFVPSQKENGSKTNSQEANTAVKVLQLVAQRYADTFNPNTSLGIITPFRAQMAHIREKMAAAFQDITVDTVERYQGSERDIILLSFALNHEALLANISAPGPGNVDRKLNVALSRAKQFVILTGVEDVLRQSPHHAALLEAIKGNGGYVESVNF